MDFSFMTNWFNSREMWDHFLILIANDNKENLNMLGYIFGVKLQTFTVDYL